MGAFYQVINGIRREIWIVASMSMILSLLQLAPAIFMLQVYGRVIATGSTETLLALGLIMLIATASLILMDLLRSRILNRAANKIYVEHVNNFASYFEMRNLRGERAQGRSNMPSALPHIQSVHSYVTSPGFAALFDIPWVPIYFLALYLLHPWLAGVALAGTILCVIIAYISGVFKDPEPELDNLYNQTSRNLHEEIFTLKQGRSPYGSYHSLLTRWWKVDNKRMGRHLGNVMRNITSSIGIKSTRVTLQSAILATASLAVIVDGASPAIIIASSILVGRSVDPFIQGLNSVTALKNAIFAAKHIKAISQNIEIDDTTQALIKLVREDESPVTRLTFSQVNFIAPGTGRAILRQIDLKVDAGDTIILTGGSGAGKTTLLKMLAGVSMPTHGNYEINGVDSRLYANDVFCKRIGFMPQENELMPGSLLENIIGFKTSVNEKKLERAIRLSGINKFISNFDKGIKERVEGSHDLILSSGQKAQICLARAIYDDPDVLILDEPAASFDLVALKALAETAQYWSEKQGIMIIAAHRKTDLPIANRVILVQDGQLSILEDEKQKQILEQQQQEKEEQQEKTAGLSVQEQQDAVAQALGALKVG